ncbi:expressed conserved protein [Echinococcus multilocularis]|uniref:Expressed conserved protein n=1 Tax=Echinococcus multilocularis TaxID=6211 RepID=A0A087VZL3_ECHMU|nr:expressed conserved protein [Echinococcus multilocularis]
MGKSVCGRVIHCSDGCYDENVDLPGVVDGGTDNIMKSEVSDATWSFRLLQEVLSLSQKVLRVADWAGEHLASMVGITDSKFDIYLWQHEYEARRQAQEEADSYIINPVPLGNNATFHMEVRKSNIGSQGGS